MTARALCPTCGRTLPVRSDDRLPRHWPSARDHLAREPRCPSSQIGTRYWPEQDTSSGPVRVQRTQER